MPRRLSLKHAAVAYVLNKEMGYTQSKVAILMDISQGTVSNMIRDFEHELQIRSLQRELDQAYEVIRNNNLLPGDNDIIVN